jgi:hypothetical protein
MNIGVIKENRVINARGLNRLHDFPEQGAQHECSNSLSAPFGSVSCGRLKSAFFINGFFGNSETFRNFSIHIDDNEIKKSLLSLDK